MQRSNDLFESIQEVIGNKYEQEIPEKNYLIAEWESSAPLEQVRLFEAKEAIRSPNVSKKQLAEAMVEISNSSYMTNPDRDPDSAIICSIQNFRTQSHLRESWQSMGKMIEEAHKRFSIDLKESLGSYNETQVNLLEMTLELPWKLSYSEPVDVEIQDYPVPQDNDPWKGKTEQDMRTDDDSEVETHDISDDGEDEMDIDEENKNLHEGLRSFLKTLRAKGSVKVLTKMMQALDVEPTSEEEVYQFMRKQAPKESEEQRRKGSKIIAYMAQGYSYEEAAARAKEEMNEEYVQNESKSIYALSLSERLRVKRNDQRSKKDTLQLNHNEWKNNPKRISESILEEATKYFGSSEGMSYAVKIDGVPNDYYSLPFGHKIDYRRKIKDFKAGAKSTYVGAKGESTMKAVKKWVKDTGVSQFYAKWKSDSRMHSPDSVEIFYKE